MPVRTSITDDLKPVVRRFGQENSGTTAVITSIVIVAVMSAMGLFVDYARQQSMTSDVQSAVDAAVLAGVTSSVLKEHQLETASRFFAANADVPLDNVTVAFAHKQEALTGTVTGTMPTTIMRIAGQETMPINVTATAIARISREPMCIMAMHETRKHTLELKDSVSVIAPDCHIYGNSNHFNDVVDPHTLENFLVGLSVAAVGGGHHYLENVAPPVEFGHEIIPDVLEALTVPPAGACLETGRVISGGSHTLEPGHYCGGLTVEANARVQLVPGGIYTISGGTFAVTGASLEGVGTTILLADASTNVEWKDSKIKLKAPSSGTYAGIAVLGARMPTSNVFEDSTVDIHGVFYMPKGAFVWENSGTPEITAKWSAFVVDGFLWTGSGKINLAFDLENSDVPYPEEMRMVPRPTNPRLTR